MFVRQAVAHGSAGSRVGPALAGLIALAAASGCVERTLWIDSQPRGARVTINGHPAGVTPTGPIRFDHYGTYEIMLERDGYEPLVSTRKLAAPWYDRFPLDFFVECLWPGRITVRREYTFALRPVSRPDRAKLIERATRSAVQFKTQGGSQPQGGHGPKVTDPRSRTQGRKNPAAKLD